MGIVIDGADSGEWSITPSRDEVELALTVRGRRFVAAVPVSDMPAVERLMVDLPLPAPGEKVDVSSHFIRVLGHDPFVEQPVDNRPWYRRLLRPQTPNRPG
ncbi:hypothetical protein [Actinoplanes sp. N902-109]|uniref:hypothetical protein n=1 Tax=Actinoplanes sp. (strain N902-109) TaxID=649831 RepID=UPI0003293DEF|nr:hypothetical protein [Actinoplanes sp. N902-109]AGL20496.1 hypothetical protein L083_6986 [Actinoplanes sp. N902-109]